MNTTIVNTIKYRWINFYKTAKRLPDSYKFFALKSFDFLNIETTSNEDLKQLNHGHYSNYTKNTKRYITMVFGAFADNEQERFDLIKKVSYIFEPPANPTDAQMWYHELSFIDPNGKTWTCEAKTVDRPEPSDFDNYNWIEFRVKLLVKDDTCLYGPEFVLSDENRVKWVSLTTTLYTDLAYPHALNINYQWISDAPLNCKITSIIDNSTEGYLIIWSYCIDGTSTYMKLNNINLMSGDEIYIDSINKKITHNGFDITGKLELPYSFPYLKNVDIWILPWNNRVVVDCGNIMPVLDVEWNYKETWR